METTEIRNRVASLPRGAKVRIKLEDGTDVAGTFDGLDGDQVHIEGNDDVALDRVETVLMDVSSSGPE
jgi:hypothetical protein